MTMQPTEFYVAGGTLPPDAPSYIVRAADETLYAGLKAGKFCYVLTSRQMGKSSLMHHTARRLKAEGRAVVTLDLSKLGTNLTLDQWYFGLLRGIGQQLRMQPELAAHWEQQAALSPLQRLFTALEERVAPACPSGLILFVDEIDIVRRLPFSADEFFAAIRERYNARGVGPERHPVTFCLLGVAAPGDLISDPRTTPFNIGLRIELTDFTAEEAAPLAEGLCVGNSGGGVRDQAPGGIRSPAPDAQQLLARVLYWTGGHPYLTQRLCLDLAEQARSGAPVAVDRRCAALFFGSRTRQEETNLAFVQNTVLQLSADVAGLLELYRRIRRGRRVPDDPTSPQVNLLCLSGLAHPYHGRLMVRNRIYARVFDAGWIETSMPHAELRRQRAAYRLGVFRTLALSVFVLALVGGLAWNAALNARRAGQAAQRADKNALLYLAARDTAQRKAAEAERSATAARKATARAKYEAQQRKAALDIATRARARERDAQRQTLNLLAEAQADQGVQALERGDAAGLLDLAASCRTAASPDVLAQRAALWYRWYTSCDVQLAQIISQAYPINKMLFLPTDGRLVTGGIDGRIRFWNCRTGIPEGAPLTPDGPVDLLAVSPDGRYLAVSTHIGKWTDEARVKLWDLHTGQEIPVNIEKAQKAMGAPSAERTIFQIVFTPDSRQLAVAASPNHLPNSVVWLFDTATGFGRNLYMAPDVIYSIQFARHAPLALLHIRPKTGGGVARLIDTRDQHVLVERVAAEDCSLLDGDGSLMAHVIPQGAYYVVAAAHHVLIAAGEVGANRVAFQPGGSLLAVGSRDGLVCLLRPPSQRRFELPPALGSVTDLRFAPDGGSLAVQSANAVTLYRLDTLEVMQRIVNAEGIEQIEYSPDSRALAVRAGNSVRLWRLKAANALRELGPGRPAQCTACSPDGRYVATVDDTATLRVWEAASGKPVSPPMRSPGVPIHQERGLMSLRFSPDGACVILAGDDYRLHCWDWRAGRERWHTPKQVRDIRALAISPDGRRIATAAGLYDEFCLVRQWDARTGWMLKEIHEPDIANGLAYSPDGTRLLMVGCARTATIRDVATGAVLGQPLRHSDVIQCLAWSRDGRQVVTCARDGIAQVWDGRTGKPLRLPLRHRERVNVVAFSPGDRYIATACQSGIVQLWDAATGVPVGTPMDHHGETVNQLVFSPDGRLLFTSSMDSTGERGSVHAWEVPSGRPAGYPLVGMDGRCRISVSPDGRWLLGSPSAGWRNAGGDPAAGPAALLWRIPQVPPLSAVAIERRTRLLLGLRRNAQHFVESLPPDEWRASAHPSR